MLRLLKNWYNRHFSQPGTVEFALVLIGAFLTVYYLMWLVGPLVVALCLAYCLDWGVRALIRRFKLSRPLASAIVMLLFIGFAVGVVVLVLPRVIKQGTDFYNSVIGTLPQEQSVEVIEPEPAVPAADSENTEIAVTSAGGSDLRSAAASAAGSEASEENPNTLTAGEIDSSIANKLHDLVQRLPDPLPSMVTMDSIYDFVHNTRETLLINIARIMKTQVMPSVMNAVTWLAYCVIVPIFMFLMLANKRVLQKRLTTYILPNNQVLLREFWPKINAQIEGYIRGKMIHILIIAVVNTLCFKLFGLNYGFLLGIGVGLSVVIPYVGAILITIPLLLIAVMQFGFTSTLIWLLICYLIIQVLDGNVLTPLLFSKVLNLDAFSILAAVLIFGGLWGFWGVFFSIPLATFFGTLLSQWPSKPQEPETDPGTGSQPQAPAKSTPEKPQPQTNTDPRQD